LLWRGADGKPYPEGVDTPEEIAGLISKNPAKVYCLIDAGSILGGLQ
jgi:hypothetical protein